MPKVRPRDVSGEALTGKAAESLPGETGGCAARRDKLDSTP